MKNKFVTEYKSQYNSLPNTGFFKTNDFSISENVYSATSKPKEEKRGIFDLARFFLSIESMTNKKLQKLCYYAQAWHLALEDEPLLNCNFEAWVHGPVCPELYYKYRTYGYENIPQYTGSIDDINEEYRSFGKEVFEAYGDLSGNELELISHQETPWKNARMGLKPWEKCNKVILEEDMKNYYREYSE